MTIESLLLMFHSDMVSVERLSENSAATYEECAKIFLNWLACEQVKLASVSPQVLLSYLIWRRTEQKCDELTIAKDISGIRSLGSYLVRQKLWQENHAMLLDRPKASRSLPKVLSIDEFKGNAGGEKYQTIVTDAEHKKVLDVLPNRFEVDPNADIDDLLPWHDGIKDSFATL